MVATPQPSANEALLGQIRDAMRRLGPLLRRRGTSADMGLNLRRAVQHLDKALLGGAVPAAAVNAAVEELNACLALAQRSDREADRAQVDGIVAVLAMLAKGTTSREPPKTLLAATGNLAVRLERSAQPLPPPPSESDVLAVNRRPVPRPIVPPETAPAVPTVPLSSSPSLVSADQQPPRPASVPEPVVACTPVRDAATAAGALADSATILSIASQISGLHGRRLAYLDDDEAKPFEIANLETSIGRRTIALRWNAMALIDNAGRLLDRDPTAATPIEVAVALLHLDGPLAATRAFELVTAFPPDESDCRRFLGALRLAGSSQAASRAKDFFETRANQLLRSLMMPFLLERALLSKGELVALLDDESDDVRAAAAAIAHKSIDDQRPGSGPLQRVRT